MTCDIEIILFESTKIQKIIEMCYPKFIPNKNRTANRTAILMIYCFKLKLMTKKLPHFFAPFTQKKHLLNFASA